MAARNKIKKERYMIVGIICLLLFSLGFALGFVIDKERVNWAKQLSNVQQLNFESLQLQQFYLTNLPKTNESCSVMKITLEDSLADLGYTLDRITQYSKDTKTNQGEYADLSRKYILDNLKYWMFTEQAKDICNMSIVTVLYFYSDKECNICPSQGTVLTYYKKIFGERLLIFPINIDHEKNENMIKIIRSRYKAYELPSVVIAGKTYSGIVSKQDLGEIICNSFPERQQECVYK